jgi:hypothetical protein
VQAFGHGETELGCQTAQGIRQLVACLTSSDLAACRASTACCSTLLIGTNLVSGRVPATHRAAASAASFFLPLLTNGLTASGAISFTS